MLYISIILAIVIALWYYKKTETEISKKTKILLTFLRFISIAICLTLLFNPIYYYKYKQLKKPLAVLLFDDSNSMNIIQADSTSKKNMYFNIQKKIGLQYKNAGYDVKKYNFASTINGNKQSTNLKNSLSYL